MIDYDPHSFRSHILDIRGSMLRELVSRVLVFGAWCLAVVLVHRYSVPLAITALPHQLIGVALGLLLVFRTNASYDRFWEGRRLWGSITNTSRNLARQLATLCGKDPAIVRHGLHWLTAFPFATMHHLRGTHGLGDAIKRLNEQEVEEALHSGHAPLFVATQLSRNIAQAHGQGLVSDILAMQMESLVRQLVDDLGGCERIHRTPLPFAYVVHVRRAVIAYFVTLPFALVGDMGWFSILAVLCMAYVFFGIEEIGVEIEDPFGQDDNDLPLEAICANIQTNVLAQMPQAAKA